MVNDYRKLLHNLPDAFAYHQIITDEEGLPVDGIFLDVNTAFVEKLGIPGDQVIGKTITEVLPGIKDASFDWLGTYGQVALSGQGLRFEEYFKPFRRRYDVTVFSDEPGYFALLLRDSSKNGKTAEDRVSDSKHKQDAHTGTSELAGLLEEMLNSTIMWINTLDIEGNVTFWNKAAEQMSGYKAEEVIGHKRIWAWLYPNSQYRLEVFQKVQGGLQKGKGLKNLETLIRRRDGEFRTILWNSSYLTDNGEIIGSIALGADITKRKQAEENLRVLSYEYEKVFHGTQDALFLVGVVNEGSFRYIRSNQAHQRLTGIDADEIRGKTPQELVGDALGSNLVANYSRCVAAGSPITYEENLDLPAGNLTWHTTLTPVFQGRTAYIVGCSQDITKRKQAEEALRASEEQYRLLVSNADEGIVVFQEGYIRFANPVSEKIYGCSAEEMKSRPWVEFVHPDDRDAARRRTQKRLQGEKVKNSYTFRLIAADGSVKWIENSVASITWGKHPAALVLMTDITGRKRKEQEYLRADKLESIGILAGGIAHDFNNLLTIILGNVSLSKLQVDKDSKLYRFQGEVEKATLQAKDLTRQLLTFAKGGGSLKEVTPINELLKGLLPFALSGSNIGLKTAFSNPTPLAAIDAGQISQVMNNLVINAAQSMQEGGTISIEVEPLTLTEEGISKRGFDIEPGDYVRIDVKDEGIGISEDVISKIFDPFFTTKDTGSGLGLAVCYSIIRNHAGHISVHSKPGQGSTFSFYLPAVSEGRDKVSHPQSRLYRGQGKILLMDDEDGIRNVVRDMLNSLGFQTVVVHDGLEAIRVYKEALANKEPFQAVIMDLTIRGSLGGKETIERLLTIDEGIRAIVSSGYSNNTVLTEYETYGFSGAVAKPYKIEELSRVLHDVLGGSG